MSKGYGQGYAADRLTGHGSQLRNHDPLRVGESQRCTAGCDQGPVDGVQLPRTSRFVCGRLHQTGCHAAGEGGQLCQRHRFDQVDVRTSLHTSNPLFQCASCCGDDDASSLKGSAVSQPLQTVAIWQTEVENHNVVTLRLYSGGSGYQGAGAVNPEAFQLQIVDHAVAQIAFIFNDQYSCGGGGRWVHGARASWDELNLGSQQQNDEPSPIRLVSSSCPPLASMMSLAIDSPRPRPRTGPSGAMRRYSLKTASRRCSAMPGPWSVTAMPTLPSLWRVAIRISLPALEYLAALSKRLPNAISRRYSSASTGKWS